MTYETRYTLIVTDQVPSAVVAEWMMDLGFRKYYDERISRLRRGRE